MNFKKDSLTISDGVLISSSRVVMNANLNRKLKQDSIWVPAITLVSSKESKLYFNGHSLRKEGVPDYIWDKDKISEMVVSRYCLIPGEIEDDELLKRRIMEIPEAFVPDKKDICKRTENISLIVSENDLDYSYGSGTFGFNSRIFDIGNVVYCLIRGMYNERNVFGYDFKHNGEGEFPPKLYGKISLSENQESSIVTEIRADFYKKFNEKYGAQHN